MRIWNRHPAAVGLVWISTLAVGGCGRSAGTRQTTSADSMPVQRSSTPSASQQPPGPVTDSAHPPPLRDAYHQAPRDTVSQVVYTGWKYFNLNCARCHGEDVTGTTIAPHLIDSFQSGKVDHDEFWRVVHGSRALKGMPNWTGIIDDDKLEAIFQYIKDRSAGKLHPGRPAVKV